jgi:hypothetical protein
LSLRSLVTATWGASVSRDETATDDGDAMPRDVSSRDPQTKPRRTGIWRRRVQPQAHKQGKEGVTMHDDAGRIGSRRR